MYIRFAVSERSDSSDQPLGVFAALYALEGRGELDAAELEWFRAAEGWLNRHLPRPDRLAWSTRPNAPERGISWIRASASEHITHLRALTSLLEHKGISVTEFRTEKPGYVLYEDDFQVIAMPFEHETF